VSGPTKIVISLDEQRVAVLKNEKLIGLSPISSGREGYNTGPGVFKVTEKDVDHRSSWYGAFVDDNQTIVIEDVDIRKDKAPPGTKFLGAEMRYFMRFNGPIGLHQGYLPGYPASHGCIRVPAHMAHLLYEVTPHGSVVEVKQNAGLIAMRPVGAPSVLTQQAVDSPIAPPALVPAMQMTPPPAEVASLEVKSEAKPSFFSRLIPEQKTKPTEPEAQKPPFLIEANAPDAIASAPPKPEKPKRSWFAPNPSASAPDAIASAPPQPEETKRSWFAPNPSASAPDAIASAPTQPEKPKRGWFAPNPSASAPDAIASAPTQPEKPKRSWFAPTPSASAPDTIASAPTQPEKPKRGWFAPTPSASAPDAIASAPPKPEKPKRSWFAPNPSASAPDAIASAPPKPEKPKVKPIPEVVSPAPLVATPAPSKLAPIQRKPVQPTRLRPISPNVPGAPPVRMTLAPRSGTDYLPGYDR
jgi:hypothetical protein